MNNKPSTEIHGEHSEKKKKHFADEKRVTLLESRVYLLEMPLKGKKM